MKPVIDWNSRYKEGNIGWDVGNISTPLKGYFDQLTNKSLRILVPGGGNGYEVEYLFTNGFNHSYLLDIAPQPLRNFSTKHPEFPKTQLVNENFFEHQGKYDLIVEQTFFCAIDPKHRKVYAEKVAELLNPGGKLIGLLWSTPMNKDHPPFGGNKAEYLGYFSPLFKLIHFEEAYNSIKPRLRKELFILAEKKG